MDLADMRHSARSAATAEHIEASSRSGRSRKKELTAKPPGFDPKGPRYPNIGHLGFLY